MKKRFFVLGWLAFFAFFAYFNIIVILILQLINLKNANTILLIFLIIFTLLLPILYVKGLHILEINDEGIHIKSMKKTISFIKWDSIVETGICKFGVLKLIYVSEYILSENQKKNMSISNVKNTFIRLIYRKKIVEIIANKWGRGHLV